ncbi:hypothetical protein [Schlesneria sp. T3-172]|uniref:hypothetical protein n=1 Tax=Schlesneria sphaerica TaxID=3373610 RepID=UPI0037C66D3E
MFAETKTFASALLFAMFLLCCEASAQANAAGDSTIVGTFIRHADHKLQMTDTKGKERSLLLSLELKVSCDGSDCNVSDLKNGMKIRVTTLKSDKQVAIEIEALDKQQAFANTQDGKLASLTDQQISLLDINGEISTYTFGASLVVTLEGLTVKREDLKAGMQIRITSSPEQKSVATRIQARRSPPDFRN